MQILPELAVGTVVQVLDIIPAHVGMQTRDVVSPPGEDVSHGWINTLVARHTRIALRCSHLFDYSAVVLCLNEKNRMQFSPHTSLHRYNVIASNGIVWLASRTLHASCSARRCKARSAVSRANSGKLLLSDKCAKITQRA